MIRPASGLDIPVLLELEEELFPNSMTERMLHHELSRGWGWIDGEPANGYILVRADDDLLDITRLGVRKTAQKQGIGRRLLETALVEGKSMLLTVGKDNAPALRLYRKYGFEIVGHLSSAGAWVMQRPALERVGLQH